MPSRICHKSSLTRWALLGILAIGASAPAFSQPATDAGPAARAFFPQSSGPGFVTGTLQAPQTEAPGADAAPVRTTPPPAARAPVRFVPPPSRSTPRPPTPWERLPAFDNATAQRIDAAIPRIAAIVAAGGWPRLEPTARLAEGQRTASTETLRRRLEIEGDLNETIADRDLWDAAVTEGLRRFQLRHGLSPTGSIGVLTRRALSVSAEQRLNALQRSRARIAQRLPEGSRYVVVNIPAAMIEAVDDGVVQRRHIAVVGRAERASPQIDARINAINLNPNWTVPPTILREDIAPRMQRDPGYLARQRIRVFEGGRELDPSTVDWSSGRALGLTLRQDPGPHNSLGYVRIAMPNPEAVYLHDTPSRGLFANDARFHSSGCVRVEDVIALSAWLLEGTGSDEASIRRGIESGERRDLRLQRPVATHWVYLTAWATSDGTIHFREDVYGLDGDRPVASVVPRRPRPAATAETVTSPSQPRPAAHEPTPLFEGWFRGRD